MRAVLFDLDGTLLRLDLPVFLRSYFAELERHTTSALDPATDSAALLGAIKSATGLMLASHPGRTNREVFTVGMRELTGFDIDANWGVFDTFYRDVFPGLAGDAGPASGAHQAVQAALGLGCKTAVATNPIFPREAIVARLGWAGLADAPFDVITSFEFMEACKPHPEYFLQVAQLLGVAPEECVMVGDDPVLDMSAADVGMRTYYVGTEPCPSASFAGDLSALAELLPRLCDGRPG